MRYKNGKHRQHKEHLKGREIGSLHTLEIVADHITRAYDKIAYSAEHATIAQSPHIQETQHGSFKRISSYAP